MSKKYYRREISGMIITPIVIMALLILFSPYFESLSETFILFTLVVTYASVCAFLFTYGYAYKNGRTIKWGVAMIVLAVLFMLFRRYFGI